MPNPIIVSLWLLNAFLGLIVAVMVYHAIFGLFENIYEMWQNARENDAERRRSYIREFGEAIQNKKAHPIFVRFIEAAGGRVELTEWDIARHPKPYIRVSENPKNGSIVFSTHSTF